MQLEQLHIAKWIFLLSQQLLKLSNVCSCTCPKTPTPLNDALVHLFHFHGKHAANAFITFYDFSHIV